MATADMRPGTSGSSAAERNSRRGRVGRAGTSEAAPAEVVKRQSENRKCPAQIKLRLRHEQEEKLRKLAAEAGFRSVQAYILDRHPEIAEAS
jgi:hypothetical protein